MPDPGNTSAMHVETTSKTAWVLSGGGSLGAVQVGMLAELIAAGVVPDLIVGVSAGALNGAFLAHNACVDTVARMAMLWSQITTQEVLGLSWRSILGMLGLRDHIASAQGLRKLLLRELPYRTFSQSAIPLHLVCTDLITGEEVVISEGEVIEAVIASAAIPGVFPSVLYQGRHLVDGAVSASTPISVAVRLGATRVIVLPCGFACASNSIPTRPWGRAMHAITLMGARQLLRDFEHFSNSIMVSIAPPVCPLDQSSYDYSNGAKLIARGRASTRAWLDNGGLACRDFPAELTIHSHQR
jgi:NTE family protein